MGTTHFYEDKKVMMVQKRVAIQNPIILGKNMLMRFVMLTAVCTSYPAVMPTTICSLIFPAFLQYFLNQFHRYQINSWIKGLTELDEREVAVFSTISLLLSPNTLFGI